MRKEGCFIEGLGNDDVGNLMPPAMNEEPAFFPNFIVVFAMLHSTSSQQAVSQPSSAKKLYCLMTGLPSGMM
jgi:hypothetical protein